MLFFFPSPPPRLSSLIFLLVCLRVCRGFVPPPTTTLPFSLVFWFFSVVSLSFPASDPRRRGQTVALIRNEKCIITNNGLLQDKSILRKKGGHSLYAQAIRLKGTLLPHPLPPLYLFFFCCSPLSFSSCSRAVFFVLLVPFQIACCLFSYFAVFVSDGSCRVLSSPALDFLSSATRAQRPLDDHSPF